MKARRLSSLVFILMLALVLRLIAIDMRNLWYDEAFAVLFAEKGLDAMLYGTLTPVAGGAADIHPLLYYSTLNVWISIFGESLFAVRLWSVLLGVATVYLLYLLARDLFDERTGLTAALIAALSPFHVQYSQETRMYSLMALLLIGVTLCFVRGWRSPRWGWWLAFGVLSGLAMYTQQLSAFYLAALGLIPLVMRRRDIILRVGVGTGVALVVYAPWLVNIPSQLDKVGSYYWIAKPGVERFIATFWTLLSGWYEFRGAALIVTLLFANVLVIFLIVQTVFWLRRPRRDTGERGALLFALWLFALPIILMWLFSQVRPVYLDRGLIASALMLYVAFAWLFTRAGLPRPIAAALGGAGIVVAVVGLYTHYTWAIFPNALYREAIVYIGTQWQVGDVVVHQDKISALPMIYYDRALTQRYVADEAGAPDDTLALPTQQGLGLLADECLPIAAQGAARVWFVTLARAEQESRGQFELEGESTLSAEFSWLNSAYTLIEQQQFNDLNIYLYANPTSDFPTECD